MDSIEIVRPQEGEVTITMSYETASALTRVLGLVNTGSSDLTGISKFSEALLAEFGNNDHPKGEWTYAKVSGGQIFIEREVW